MRQGRVHGGHHDARLSGGPRLGQATPLRSVPCGAYGLDRTAAPPEFGNYVMASRLTVALMRDRIDSSSKESRRYDPISRAAQSASATRNTTLVRRAIVAMNRCERSFARSLDKPHASCSRASWRRNDRIDLR